MTSTRASDLDDRADEDERDQGAGREKEIGGRRAVQPGAHATLPGRPRRTRRSARPGSHSWAGLLLGRCPSTHRDRTSCRERYGMRRVSGTVTPWPADRPSHRGPDRWRSGCWVLSRSSVAGAPIVVDTRKALAIVALVAAEGRPFARDELAAMFWPEADDEAARGALRRTLSALRTAVGDAGLLIERTRVALDPSQVSVDLGRPGTTRRPRSGEPTSRLPRPSPAALSWRASPCATAPPSTTGRRPARGRVERTVGGLLDRLGSAPCRRRRYGRGDRGRPGPGGARPPRRGRPAPSDRAPRCGRRPGRGDPPVSLAGRPVRPRAGRGAAARDDRRVRGDPRGAAHAGDRGRLPGPVVVPATQAGVPAPPVMALPFVGRDRRAGRHPRRRCDRDAGRTADPRRRGGGDRQDTPCRGCGRRRARRAAASCSRRAAIRARQRSPTGRSPICLRSGLATPGGAERLTALDPAALGEIGRLVELPAVVARICPGRARRAETTPACGCSKRSPTRSPPSWPGPIPGLVSIDDLHHADGATRQAVAYLARRLHGRPHGRCS